MTNFDKIFMPEFQISTFPPVYPPVELVVTRGPIGSMVGSAADVWALGCAIFRLRSGYDLFSNKSTARDYFRQIVSTIGNPPEGWIKPTFDKFGVVAVAQTAQGGRNEQNEDEGKEGDKEETEEEVDCSITPLKDRIRAIVDEPFLSIMDLDEAVELAETATEPDIAISQDEVLHPVTLKSIAWKPSQTENKITDDETSSLLDLFSKIFTYNPTDRANAKDLVNHHWSQTVFG
jgi:serine/threonine-protein kinase SRPK3